MPGPRARPASPATPGAAGRVVVGAAILSADGRRVLAAQRATPPALAGWWEFPGGKVHAGESEPEALRRECREELGVEVEAVERVGDDRAAVGDGLVLRVWLARLVAGEPRPLEHAALRWLAAAELGDVAWLEPDLPAVAALRGRLAPSGPPEQPAEPSGG